MGGHNGLRRGPIVVCRPAHLSAADKPLFSFAGPASWKDVEYKMSMDEILGALRLKVWRELDSIDAKRFKFGRVRHENIPRGVFNALARKLKAIAKQEGEGGSQNFWRRRYITNIKNGERSRSCLTFTTVAPARELLNMGQVGQGGDLLHPTASFATGLVKITNLSYGTVKFVDLPLAVERVMETVNGVTTITLELGFGIGVVPDCDGTVLRHASGDPGFEANQPLPSVDKWPVLPPYDSFGKYMKFHVGKEIKLMNAQLIKLSKDQAAAAGSEEGPRSLSKNLTTAAATWHDIANPPGKVIRQFWHHPDLRPSKCGDEVPDHEQAARAAEQAAREAQQAAREEARQRRTEAAFNKIEGNASWIDRWRTRER